eukprot:7102396-Lingulodinium_polyedra.AAC.1
MANARLATMTAVCTNLGVMAPALVSSMLVRFLLYSAKTRSVVTFDTAMRFLIASMRRPTSCKRW